ncbi:PREDICTED: golgin subfamily A member 6-like protein 22 [Wasmannia auropunctata]|uniref:golgin subfamily A member 6-like protein 22 n=1 Tax=Wasmannia auropunctata TaxID=64793 RepID=UPI0005EE0A7B|nr:PREDICTED: golgin subfamily A member 6-like protein 22 [Wasmannia auropunctata]
MKEEIQGILREGQDSKGEGGERGWWDRECKEYKREVRRELRRWRRQEKGGERYKEMKRQYKKLCEKKKEEERDRWTEWAKMARTEEQVWMVINRERKGRKGVDDSIETERWIEYFKEMLGGVEERVVRGIRGGKRVTGEEIERGEVTRAIGRLKEGKAVGRDEIPGEVWKFGGERLVEFVWRLCNRIWRGEEWIEEWSEGLIVPVRKKGDGDKVEDYRGVTLMPSIYKIYAYILAERLEKEVEEGGKVPQNQTGFRKGMGTVDNIYVLNYLECE